MSRKDFTIGSKFVDSRNLIFPAASELVSDLQIVERYHVQFQRKLGESVLTAFLAGRTLLGAKERTPHGSWETVLQQAIEVSGVAINVRTCQRYMKVAQLLLDYPGSIVPTGQEEFTKTTRLSFLNFLCEHRFTSISRVLALHLRSPKSQASDGETEEVSDAITFAPSGSANSNLTFARADGDLITPRELWACVTELFGEIDLDPCGTPDPLCHLPATQTIGPPHNSLNPCIRWSGKLYVHPPANSILPFVIRTVAALEEGEAEAAVVLVPSVTDAEFVEPLQPFVKGFLYRRPTFVLPSGGYVQPPVPYLVVMVTHESELVRDFAHVFARIADIYAPFRA